MTILEKLKKARVFAIDGEGKGTGLWRIYEECDSYFFEILTSEELLALATEIEALAKTDDPTQ